MNNIVLTLAVIGLISCARNKDHVEFQIPTEPAQIVVNPPSVTVVVSPNISVSTGDVNVSLNPTISNSNNNTSTGGSVGNVSSTGGTSSATNGDVVGTVSGGNNTATGGNGGSSSSTASGGAGGSNTNSNSVTSGNSTATGGGASAGNSTSNANNSGSNATTNSGSVSNSGSQSATGGSSTNNNSSSNSNNSNSGGNTVTGQNQVSLPSNLENKGSDDNSNTRNEDKDGGDSSKENKTKKNKKKTAGLSCKVYNLSATQPNALPNFNNLTPVSTITINQLDVSDVDYAGSFPKFPAPLKSMLEWYGIVCDGTVSVPKTATYTFYLTSDDGSKLSIDGSLLINNDGLHSTRAYQNNATLAKGSHDIHVEYFQGPRTRISLVLEWSSPDFSRQIVTSTYLKH